MQIPPLSEMQIQPSDNSRARITGLRADACRPASLPVRQTLGQSPSTPAERRSGRTPGDREPGATRAEGRLPCGSWRHRREELDTGSRSRFGVRQRTRQREACATPDADTRALRAVCTRAQCASGQMCTTPCRHDSTLVSRVSSGRGAGDPRGAPRDVERQRRRRPSILAPVPTLRKPGPVKRTSSTCRRFTRHRQRACRRVAELTRAVPPPAPPPGVMGPSALSIDHDCAYHIDSLRRARRSEAASVSPVLVAFALPTDPAGQWSRRCAARRCPLRSDPTEDAGPRRITATARKRRHHRAASRGHRFFVIIGSPLFARAQGPPLARGDIASSGSRRALSLRSR